MASQEKRSRAVNDETRRVRDPSGVAPTDHIEKVTISGKVTLTLLFFSLAALGITGGYGLATRDFVPVLALWGVCSPLIVLLVKKHVGDIW
jgi:hypothetical protein